LEPFDFRNMPALVERIKDLWAPLDAEEHFRQIYAESVIRQDMHDNEMQFQLTENGQLRAIACASRKGEKNSAEVWWQEQFKTLSRDQQVMFNHCRNYLNRMDEKAYGFMNNDDVKLDMFISIKTGWGKKLLNEAIEYYSQQGFKNLFLWTDCECNVDWYFSHGYELVDEGVYEPFSKKDEDYKTYVFMRKIG